MKTKKQVRYKIKIYNKYKTKISNQIKIVFKISLSL